jgi:ABC-2 type transport system permease protein
MNRKDLKKQNIIQLVLAVFIVALIYYIVSFAFFRIDLTQEKRHTLAPVSKQILQKLPDVVFIKVYLDGDIPSGFKRLNKSVHEMLDEFRVYANNNIQYQFIDPYEGADKKNTNAIIKELYDKGLQPTNVKFRDDKGGSSEKMVVPGAIVSYNGIEFPVSLLSNNPGISGEENLNNSLQGIEYQLINAIHSITNTTLHKIAFLEGHNELDQYYVGDIMRELSNYYQVDRGAINGQISALNAYKCIIIAQPQNAFSEEDKFVLDQYIMKGGKVMWFIDPVSINIDSFSKGNTLANVAQLNIDDQLFRYGVRLNPVLVQDVQCALLPVNSSMSNGQPKFIPAPWMYYPLLSGIPVSPVSRNLNMVKTEFCGYIDTLETSGLTKSVLLQTSKFTKVRSVPTFISLKEIKQTNNRDEFNKSNLPVAVLVEGQFSSVFKNRMRNVLKINGEYSYKESSVPTKMIVVADGDIIKNEVRQTPQGIMISPLGVDKYTSQNYGNKDFILNSVNYLTDDIGLMGLRSRELKLRLLDKAALSNNLLQWQLINVLLPLALLLIFGLGFAFYRKKHFSF